jgi:aminomethyltransferase
MPAELLQTPLHPWHVAHAGRMVEFGGWSMPVQYTSIVDEHRAVRTQAGIFDISHMGRLDFEGPHALDWLERVTTNHVARLRPGQIQYSLICDEKAGIIDDVLVYRHPDGALAMVCNASNRANVLAQLEAHKGTLDARVHDRTIDLAMIAVQGPHAIAALEVLADSEISSVKYYHAAVRIVLGTKVLLSRTGYTGEDGFEVILPAPKAIPLWEALMRPHGGAPQVMACGLGARDTLRFEAAMPLYGHELSLSINPYEAGVGWAVKLQKGTFIGSDALAAAKQRVARTRIGLALEGKRIAREGTVVSATEGGPVGLVTSGTFAPTLQRALAMALVDAQFAEIDQPLTLDVRGRVEPARVVVLPFYRRPSS